MAAPKQNSSNILNADGAENNEEDYDAEMLSGCL